MADNVTTQTTQLSTVPDGTVIATDQLADGSHAQLVKIIDGTANGTTAAVVNATGLKVDASGAAVPVTDNSGTLTVDDGGLTLSVDDGAGSLTVDNAGTFAVQAAQSGTWNITTVTTLTGITNVVHVDDNAGSLTVDNAVLSVVGGGTEATAQRVTIASDSTGVLSVDDNGGSLTVDNAALSVTGGGVEASALRVTIASDSTGVLSVDDNGGSITVDNGGTFATQATLQAGSATIGKVYSAYQTTKALTNASVSISSSGDNTVVSGTASQTIRVYKLVLVAAAAVNVTIKDATAGTSLTGAIPLTANGALVIDFDSSGEPAFVSASGGNFVVNLSGAVTVTGFVQYTKS